MGKVTIYIPSVIQEIASMHSDGFSINKQLISFYSDTTNGTRWYYNKEDDNSYISFDTGSATSLKIRINSLSSVLTNLGYSISNFKLNGVSASTGVTVSSGGTINVTVTAPVFESCTYDYYDVTNKEWIYDSPDISDSYTVSAMTITGYTYIGYRIGTSGTACVNSYNSSGVQGTSKSCTASSSNPYVVFFYRENSGSSGGGNTGTGFKVEIRPYFDGSHQSSKDWDYSTTGTVKVNNIIENYSGYEFLYAKKKQRLYSI